MSTTPLEVKHVVPARNAREAEERRRARCTTQWRKVKPEDRFFLWKLKLPTRTNWNLLTVQAGPDTCVSDFLYLLTRSKDRVDLHGPFHSLERAHIEHCLLVGAIDRHERDRQVDVLLKAQALDTPNVVEIEAHP